MYLPRDRVNREMTEAIQIIFSFVGNGYRQQGSSLMSFELCIVLSTLGLPWSARREGAKR